jgi:serine racemase
MLFVVRFPQVPELDVIVVPVSGGGMLSGITLAAKALKPSILVIAAEPCGSNDAADVAASKRAGQLVTDLPKPITIADGLQGDAFYLTSQNSASCRC